MSERHDSGARPPAPPGRWSRRPLRPAQRARPGRRRPTTTRHRDRRRAAVEDVGPVSRDASCRRPYDSRRPQPVVVALEHVVEAPRDQPRARGRGRRVDELDGQAGGLVVVAHLGAVPSDGHVLGVAGLGRGRRRRWRRASGRCRGCRRCWWTGARRRACGLRCGSSTAATSSTVQPSGQRACPGSTQRRCASRCRPCTTRPAPARAAMASEIGRTRIASPKQHAGGAGDPRPASPAGHGPARAATTRNAMNRKMYSVSRQERRGVEHEVRVEGEQAAATMPARRDHTMRPSTAHHHDRGRAEQRLHVARHPRQAVGAARRAARWSHPMAPRN